MSFNINGSVWYLKFVRPSNKNLQRSDGTWTIGMTDNKKKIVFIADNLSEYMFIKVLCHELTHVFSFSYDLTLDIETEEIIADFMSLYGRDIIYLADDIMHNLRKGIA